jgi:hypothetical protein
MPLSAHVGVLIGSFSVVSQSASSGAAKEKADADRRFALKSSGRSDTD